MVSGSRFSKTVHQAAADVLLQLLTGLQRSLALAQHPEFAHSEYGDSFTATLPAAAAAAAGIHPQIPHLPKSEHPSGSAAAPIDNSSSMLAAAKLIPGYTAAAKALAAAKAPVFDPTCPNTYPQLPMPQSGVDSPWQLPVSVMENQRVDVTAAVNSICLQVGVTANCIGITSCC